jgi:hypothetical protein
MSSNKIIDQKQFDLLAFRLIDKLDDICQKYLLQDEEYKSFIEDIVLMKNNSVYKYIEKKAKKPRKPLAPAKSLQEKINDPNYIGCHNCNAIIKKSAINIHFKTKKCSTISQTKKTTLKTTKFLNFFEDRNLQLLNEVYYNRLRNNYNTKNKNITKILVDIKNDNNDYCYLISKKYVKINNKWCINEKWIEDDE